MDRMTTPATGTENLLALAEDLRTYAPNVRDAFHFGIGAGLMERAAAVIERLAPLDPDIDVQQGEN